MLASPIDAIDCGNPMGPCLHRTIQEAIACVTCRMKIVGAWNCGVCNKLWVTSQQAIECCDPTKLSAHADRLDSLHKAGVTGLEHIINNLRQRALEAQAFRAQEASNGVDNLP